MKSSIANASRSVARARKKLESRLADLEAEAGATALAEAKAKNQQQLDRRTNHREPVDKETLAQFANCKKLVNESPALRKLREKVGESDAQRR